MSSLYEEAIQPLLDAHAALEADIQGREAELTKLKEQRNRLRNAVRAVAPERLPGAASPKKQPSQKQFSQASLDYVEEFVRNTLNGGVFGTTDIVGHPDYHGVSASSLPPILRALHEQGVLRLARKGKGSSRYYEVIR